MRQGKSRNTKCDAKFVFFSHVTLKTDFALSHFTVSTLSADVRLDMITEMIDVGKQCHDSCSTSAIANKKRQLSVGIFSIKRKF